MICKHQPVKTSDVQRLPSDHIAGTPSRPILGVETVCVNCGQVRRAYVDGTVIITEPGGNPIDEDIP